jgi:CheY-like chemotaxis protein
MNANKRVLIIHGDDSTAFRILKKLQALGHEAEWVASGIEGVACFESYSPDCVLVDMNLVDLPAKFMVQALRQLNQGASILMVANSIHPGLKFEVEAWGADGVIPLDFSAEMLSAVWARPSLPVVPMGEDETIQGWVDDSSSFGRGLGQVLPSQTMVAQELIRLGTFSCPGHLVVKGSLEEMELLDVGGDLLVEGGLRQVHARVRGEARVFGEIRHCRNLGVFVRGSLQCESALDSILVCGRHFLWDGLCKDTMLNVAGRMVGLGRKSQISGGVVKVAESMRIGTLGDDQQTPTHVELAPRVFFRSWVDAKRAMLALSQHPGHVLPAERKTHFERCLRELEFFQSFAQIHAWAIESGVTLKIGEAEEMILMPKEGPLLVSKGKGPAGATLLFAQPGKGITVA